MKDQLLAIFENAGIEIEFQGQWTGKRTLNPNYTEESNDLFEDEEEFLEPQKESVIVKAVLGILASIEEHGGMEDFKKRLEIEEQYTNGIRAYAVSHWLGISVPKMELIGEGSFTINHNPTPDLTWADGSVLKEEASFVAFLKTKK